MLPRSYALLLGAALALLALLAAPGAASALGLGALPIEVTGVDYGTNPVTEAHLDNTTMYAAFLEFSGTQLYAGSGSPLDFSNEAFVATGSLDAVVENRELLFSAAVSMSVLPGAFPDWSEFPQSNGTIHGLDLQSSLPLRVTGSAGLAVAAELQVVVPSIGDPTTPVFLTSSNSFLIVPIESAMSGTTTLLAAGGVAFFLPGDTLTIRVETSLLARVSSGAEGARCVNRVCQLELGAPRPSDVRTDAFTLQLLAPVPEPGTAALLGVGLVLLAATRRRAQPAATLRTG